MLKKNYLFLLIFISLSLVVASPYSSNYLSGNPYSSNTNIVTTLKSLSDTDLNDSLDMQTLVYNATSGLWYNAYLNDSGHSVNNSILWDGHLYGDEGHWGISGSDIYYNAGDVSIANNLIVDTDTLFVDSSSDRVGIGTDSPQTKAHIKGNISEDGGPILLVEDTSGLSGIDVFGIKSSGSAAKFSFETTGNGKWWRWVLGSSGEMRYDSNDGTNKLYFRNNIPQYTLRAETDTLYVNFNEEDYNFRVHTLNKDDSLFVEGSSGNVGIGTSTPQNSLDVSGGQVIGSTYAGVNTAPTDGLLVEGNADLGTTRTVSSNHKLFIDGAVQVGTAFSYNANYPTRTDFVVGNSAGISRFLFGQSNSFFGGMQWNYRGTPANAFLSVGFMNGDEEKGLNILQNGNVGIGTTTPQNTLNVIGELNVTDKAFFPEFVGIGGQCNPALQGNGNLCVSGTGLFNSSLASFAPPRGAAVLFQKSTPSPANFFLNGTASYNSSIDRFCDTDNPFNESDDGSTLAILFSLPNTIPNSVVTISSVFNSTCVFVNPVALGNLSDQLFTNILYIKTPEPTQLILDNDATFFKVGESPDAVFQIHIPEGTGSDNVLIDYTAGVGGSHGLDIDANLFGFSGGGTMHSTLFSSGFISGGISHNLLLSSDLNNFDSGQFNGLEIILTNPGIDMESNMIEVEGNWTNLIKKGTPEALNKSWYDSTISLTDITNDVDNTSINTPVFELDDSIVYFGNTINFTSISISLDITASAPGIAPIFWYCDSDNNWNLLPSVSDETNGFQSSGKITFDNPNDRGSCNTQINGTVFSDATDYTYIAIQRTRNNLVISPSINLVSISSDEAQFLLREDLIKLSPVSSPPLICEANMAGAIYYDSVAGVHCSCNGVNWLQMDDYSTVCI